MDNRPIGFFDSGLGGLTCIPYVMNALPNERIIYFGDTARTPYGSKAVDTIRHFSRQIADFLVKNDVKMIVIACNTVSATCLADLREIYPGLPILGIISPASHTVAKRCGPENKIGIIGTKVTIESAAYRQKILEFNDALDIYETPCAAFVPLIEEGIVQNKIMDLCIRYYLDHFLSYNEIDTLVLGCTHYPLIRRNITKIYPEISIIDPSEELLQSIVDTLSKHEMCANEPPAEHTFYASDLSENYLNMINKIFGGTGISITFKTIELNDV
jgi:glutamate racemase